MVPRAANNHPTAGRKRRRRRRRRRVKKLNGTAHVKVIRPQTASSARSLESSRSGVPRYWTGKYHEISRSRNLTNPVVARLTKKANGRITGRDDHKQLPRPASSPLRRRRARPGPPSTSKSKVHKAVYAGTGWPIDAAMVSPIARKLKPSYTICQDIKPLFKHSRVHSRSVHNMDSVTALRNATAAKKVAPRSIAVKVERQMLGGVANFVPLRPTPPQSRSYSGQRKTPPSRKSARKLSLRSPRTLALAECYFSGASRCIRMDREYKPCLANRHRRRIDETSKLSGEISAVEAENTVQEAEDDAPKDYTTENRHVVENTVSLPSECGAEDRSQRRRRLSWRDAEEGSKLTSGTVSDNFAHLSELTVPGRNASSKRGSNAGLSRTAPQVIHDVASQAVSDCIFAVMRQKVYSIAESSFEPSSKFGCRFRLSASTGKVTTMAASDSPKNTNATRRSLYVDKNTTVECKSQAQLLLRSSDTKEYMKNESLVLAFIPKLELERLQHTGNNTISEPTGFSFPAAVMFCDISGFTQLTENLTNSPDIESGAETLTEILNDFFDQLIEVIERFGGDVVKFCGDAILVIFTNAPSLESLTLMASKCALCIQDEFSNYEVNIPSLSVDVSFSVHMGIGVGDVHNMYVGGMFERWEMVFAGTPMLQIKTATSDARPGETVLSPEAWGFISSRATGVPKQGSFRTLRKMSRKRKNGKSTVPAPNVLLTSLTRGADLIIDAAINCLPRFDPTSCDASTIMAARKYVPGAVVLRLFSGQSWSEINELRRVTILFFNCPTLEVCDTKDLENLQRIASAVQSALYLFEGSVNKFLVDDKGSTLIGAFGLPPLAHEDDAVRGLQCGVLVRQRMKDLGFSCSIGVTTGKIFCGVLGGSTRCEYAIMGDTVNVAARLMQHCSPDGFLCDENTVNFGASWLESKHIVCKKVDPIRVKGKSQRIGVYEPIERLDKDELKGWQERYAKKTEVIGRRKEEIQVNKVVESFLRPTFDSTLCVWIEGDPGMGKSEMVKLLYSQIYERTKMMTVYCVVSAADALETSTAYYAWRSAFAHLFNLDANRHARRNSQVGGVILNKFQNAKEMEDQVLMVLNRLSPKFPSLVSLLNVVLPHDFKESEVSRSLENERRAALRQEMLVEIVAHFCLQQKVLIVIEDCQWLDVKSWKLLQEILLRVHPIMVVGTCRTMYKGAEAASVSSKRDNGKRPRGRQASVVARSSGSAIELAEENRDIYQKIRVLPGTTYMQLDEMNTPSLLKLVASHLGTEVQRLPPLVENIVDQRARGNPFDAIELMGHLQHRGYLIKHDGFDGEVYFSMGENITCVDDIDFPENVRGLITERLDALDNIGEQMVLKTASVIGREFDIDTLSTVVDQLDFDRPPDFSVLDVLHTLSERGFLEYHRMNPQNGCDEFRFQMEIVKDVAYKMMSYAHRQQIHIKIAEHIENEHADNLPQFYMRLAEHYKKAEVFHKALGYMAHAGKQALTNNALEDAVSLYSDALALYLRCKEIEKRELEFQYRSTLKEMLKEEKEKSGSSTENSNAYKIPGMRFRCNRSIGSSGSRSSSAESNGDRPGSSPVAVDLIDGTVSAGLSKHRRRGSTAGSSAKKLALSRAGGTGSRSSGGVGSATQMLISLNASISPLVVAGWHADLGLALTNIGDMVEAKRHIECALKIRDRPFPRTPNDTKLRLLEAVIRFRLMNMTTEMKRRKSLMSPGSSQSLLDDLVEEDKQNSLVVHTRPGGGNGEAAAWRSTRTGAVTSVRRKHSNVTPVGEVRVNNFLSRHERIVPINDEEIANMPVLLELSRLYMFMSRLTYFSGDQDAQNFCIIRSLNLARKTGKVSGQLAKSYAAACLAASSLELVHKADAFATEALVLAEAVDDTRASLYVFIITSLFFIGFGKLQLADKGLIKAMLLASKQQNLRRWEEAANMRGFIAFALGNFRHGGNILKRASASAEDRNDNEMYARLLLGQTGCLLAQFNSSQALDLLEEIELMVDEQVIKTNKLLTSSLKAMRAAEALIMGEAEQAFEYVLLSVEDLLSVKTQTQVAVYIAYCYVFDVLLRLRLKSVVGSDLDPDHLFKIDVAIQDCLRSFEKFEQKFPMARVRRMSCVAGFALTLGRIDEAVELWEDAFELACEMESDYEKRICQAWIMVAHQSKASHDNITNRIHSKGAEWAVHLQKATIDDLAQVAANGDRPGDHFPRRIISLVHGFTESEVATLLLKLSGKTRFYRLLGVSGEEEVNQVVRGNVIVGNTDYS